MKWWRWDSVGAACKPKCRGCHCVNCQVGGKEMTLPAERELEVVRSELTCVTGESHSKEPHLHAKYPWLGDPALLLNNRKAVQAKFFRTEKKLTREPKLNAVYTLKCMTCFFELLQ